MIARAKAGEVQAFETLIADHRAGAYNIAYSLMGNHHDASDAAQEAFVKVYRSLSSFHEDAKFSTWLYRIVTNVCLDEIRRRKRNTVVSLHGEDNDSPPMEIRDNAPSPQESAEKNELRRAVHDAISRLSDDHKRVIVLRDIKGLSYEEIAQAERCSEGTVKSRLSRARNALKKILSQNREHFSL